MANVPAIPGRYLLAPNAEYQQSLRGPLHRGWRPLLSIVLLVTFGGISMMLTGLAWPFVLLLSGRVDPFAETTDALTDVSDPVGFLVTNLGLITLIPVSMLALWLAHGVAPRQLASVVGRFRWAWFGRCVAILLPLWLVLIGVSFLLEPGQVQPRPQQWPALLLIMLLTTPLQSAAEEVAFRGWALLSIGSWFRNRWVALFVPLALSTAAFAAAHGSADPWVLADLSVFALAAGLLTWRTGGLEAAIALHLVNNVIAIGSSILFGGFGEGFVDSDTSGTFGQFAVTLAVQGVALWLLWRQADKAALVRLTHPAPAVSPPTAGPPVTGAPATGGWPGAGTGSG